MMDGRAITEHKLIIKIIDKNECAKYDPFGLCYVDDCMSCPNARVKIIREDDIVMRDDFKDKRNVQRYHTINYFKRLFSREGINFFEEVYNKKFTKLEKWILNRIFKRISEGENNYDA